MNFEKRVSDLAPSSNERTEILLKLPTEAEKNRFHPIQFTSTLRSNPYFGTLVSGEDAAGYRLWAVCNFSCSLPNGD